MTRQIRRFATVGTLALVLFLAGAGSSQARDLSSAGAWGWLQGLWSKGVSWVVGGYGSPAPARPTQRARGPEKQGYGQDPNGSTNPGSSNGATTSTPLCPSCGNNGPGQDPNG
jgi:hypothetical protein